MKTEFRTKTIIHSWDFQVNFSFTSISIILCGFSSNWDFYLKPTFNPVFHWKVYEAILPILFDSYCLHLKAKGIQLNHKNIYSQQGHHFILKILAIVKYMSKYFSKTIITIFYWSKYNYDGYLRDKPEVSDKENYCKT